MNYIYRFLGENNEVLYVGKTTQLSLRMKQHFIYKKKDYIDEIKKVEYLEFSHKNEMSVYEIYFINNLKPKYNTEFNWGEPLTCVKECFDEWKDFDFLKELKNSSNDYTLEETKEAVKLKEHISIPYYLFTDNNFRKLSGIDFLIIILLYKNKGWINRSDIEKMVGKSSSKRTLSDCLNRLVDNKILLVNKDNPRRLGGGYEYKITSKQAEKGNVFLINNLIIELALNKNITLKDLKTYLLISRQLKSMKYTYEDLRFVLKKDGFSESIKNLERIGVLKIIKKLDRNVLKNTYEI